MAGLFILFAVINFSALGVGAWLMGNPRTNTWYQRANKAPWTPPNWVFGAAWTAIMVCFTLFLWLTVRNQGSYPLNLLYIILGVQWVLNVLWNPVFFRWHQPAPALALIIALTAVVTWFMVWGFINVGAIAVLVVPYFLWLLVAASLNWYVLAKN